MTDDEAEHVRGRMVAMLQSCPAGAIARLVESAPAENIMLRMSVVLAGGEDGPVELALTFQHAENAPAAATPPIPAEFYADRRGQEN